MSIVVLKMASSEEVIGTYDGDEIKSSGGFIKLKKAKILNLVQQGGNVGINMSLPYVLSADDGEISINVNCVAALVPEDKIMKQLVDQYISATSTIQVAAANDNLIKVR